MENPAIYGAFNYISGAKVGCRPTCGNTYSVNADTSPTNMGFCTINRSRQGQLAVAVGGNTCVARLYIPRI
jgi:hypothetical protein